MRGDAWLGFDRTNSGHQVADLAGQIRGMGRGFAMTGMARICPAAAVGLAEWCGVLDCLCGAASFLLPGDFAEDAAGVEERWRQL